MNWQQVCEHPALQDLPFKIELNGWGQVLMSPASSKHSVLQWQIQRRIYECAGKAGQVLPECPVQTRDGVKVPDVAWISAERYRLLKRQAVYAQAPEICVEVMSASNTQPEMREKLALYFAAGAEEGWICSAKGRLRFYDAQGELKHSRRFPDFPNTISDD